MPQKFDQDVALAQGLDLRSAEERVSSEGATRLENVRLDRFGVPSKMGGSVLYSGDIIEEVDELYELEKTGVSRTLLAITSTGRLMASPGDGTFSEIATGLSLFNYDFATARERAYFANGSDAKSTDGSDIRDVGLFPPDVPATSGLALSQKVTTLDPGVTTGSGVADGTYRYRISYIYDGFQESSTPFGTESPPFTKTSGGGENTVQVDWTPGAAPTGVTHVNVYRQQDSAPIGSSYFLVNPAPVAVGVGTYDDTFSDSELGIASELDVLPTSVAQPMPAFRYFAYYGNRMYAVDGLERVYVSDPLQPDRFHELGFFSLNTEDSSKITGIHPFKENMLVFKGNSVNAIRGVFAPSLSNMLPDTISNEFGCIDQGSVATVYRKGAPVVMWADREDVLAYDGGSIFSMSEMIEPLYRSIAASSNFGGSGFRTWDSDVDWATGTSSPGLDLSSPGIVESLAPIKRWDSDSQWNDNESIGPNLKVSGGNLTHDFGVATPAYTTFDEFEIQGGTPPGWTLTRGAVAVRSSSNGPTAQSVYSLQCASGSESNVYKASSRAIGAWRFSFHHVNQQSGTDPSHRVYFMATGTDPKVGTGDGYYVEIEGIPFGRRIRLGKTISGSDTLLGPGVIDSGPGSNSISVVIGRSSTGKLRGYFGGFGVETLRLEVDDASISTSSNICVTFNGSDTSSVGVHYIQEGDTNVQEDWVSNVFPTPDNTDWGIFDATIGGASSNVSYAIRTGNTATPDGTWSNGGAYEPVTDGQDVSTVSGVSDTHQYAQVKVVWDSDKFNPSTTVQSVVLPWLATSTWESEVVNAGQVPGAWAPILFNGTATGNIDVEVRSGSDDSPPTGWVSYQEFANGATPSVAVNQYIQVRATFNSSQLIQPSLDKLTIQWLALDEDETKIHAVFHDDLYILSVRTPSSSNNDLWLIQDEQGRWTTASFDTKGLALFANSLYYSGTGDGEVFRWERDAFEREIKEVSPGVFQGTPIESVIETGNRAWVESQLADNRKILKAVWLSTDSTDTFSFSVSPDENAFIPEITVPGGQSQYVRLGTKGKRHKIRIKHTGPSDFTLWKLSPEVHVLPKRRGAS